MNSSAFLSDSLKNNTEYRVRVEQTFIATNDDLKLNNKSFEILKFEKQQTNKYAIKSATSRKWSIKFKK